MLMNCCEWRNSPVFPNQYMVSEDGKVWSKRTQKLLRPALDKFGYEYYVLCVGGERKTVKAHRLVALAFVDNPARKTTVDHINGDKRDNRVENLRWATNKEQTNNPITIKKLEAAHRKTDYRAMGARRNFGRKGVVVLSKQGTVSEYSSLKEAAKETGCSYSKLSEILNGKKKQRKDFIAIWARGAENDE